jgi:hypothetical protein
MTQYALHNEGFLGVRSLPRALHPISSDENSSPLLRASFPVCYNRNRQVRHYPATKGQAVMNHDEALTQMRAVREQVTRIVQDVDAAIVHLEAFQPVAEAFQRRQAAAQAQWQDVMRAGGPDNLDVETQMRHAMELRTAELNLFNALRDYMAITQHDQPETNTMVMQGGEAASGETPDEERHSY